MPRWTWLSTKPNGVLGLQTPEEAEKTATMTDLPLVLRCVLLVMELALVGGAAFLLLLTSSVIGRVVHTLLAAGGFEGEALVQSCEAAAFCWGLVTFTSCFFQRPKRELVQRLTGFGWSNATTCLLSVLLHLVATMALVLWQEEQVMSMANVHSALVRPDEILRTLLLAPLKEELFFRGVIVLVAINRLQNAKQSAVLSSALFAAIHLANAKELGTQYSASYVAFQVVWAWLVGLFLALKFAVSGSLVECLVLHVINNIFALSVSKQVAVDLTQPLVSFSILAAFGIYAGAIARQLQLLLTTSDKQL